MNALVYCWGNLGTTKNMTQVNGEDERQEIALKEIALVHAMLDRLSEEHGPFEQVVTTHDLPGARCVRGWALSRGVRYILFTFMPDKFKGVAGMSNISHARMALLNDHKIALAISIGRNPHIGVIRKFLEQRSVPIVDIEIERQLKPHALTWPQYDAVAPAGFSA